MNRRTSSLLGTLCAISVLAIAACSGGSSDGSSAPPGTVKLTTSVEKPTGEVDSIKWNIGTGEPTTIDPAQSTLDNVSTVVGNLCEGLMTFGPSYSVEPALAEKVSQSDSTTYVYDLREGTKFWNGDPVTTEDVIFSIKRTFAAETASSWAAAYENLASVKATGPSQVTVKFKSPTALFKWYQATPATAVVQEKFAKAAGKGFGSSSGGIMCTGPYKVDAWRSGQDITISRSSNYWGDKPLVKKATFTFDTDAASRSAALLNGDVDGAFQNPVSSAKRLLETKQGHLMFGQSLSPVFISTFVNDKAIKVSGVREALRKAVDYEGVVKRVYGGAAEPIKLLTGPATWGYSKEIFQKSYDTLPTPKQDLAEAKNLVASAGDVPPLTIAYDNSNVEESKIALSLQSSAEQVGLTVKLRSLPPNEFFKIFYDAKAREGLSGYVLSGYLDFPEPIEYDLYATTGSYYNYAGYENPKYDELMKTAVGTLDDSQRAELVTQAERSAAKDGYNIPLVSPYLNVFVNKRLTGLVPEQRYLYTPWVASLGAVS